MLLDLGSSRLSRGGEPHSVYARFEPGLARSFGLLPNGQSGSRQFPPISSFPTIVRISNLTLRPRYLVPRLKLRNIVPGAFTPVLAKDFVRCGGSFLAFVTVLVPSVLKGFARNPP